MQTVIKRICWPWLELLGMLGWLIHILGLLMDLLCWRNLSSLVVSNWCWSLLLTWSLSIIWRISCLLLTLWWLPSLVVLCSSLLVLSVVLLLDLDIDSLRNISHLWLLEAPLNLNIGAEELMLQILDFLIDRGSAGKVFHSDEGLLFCIQELAEVTDDEIDVFIGLLLATG